jgi:leader peptidase (prepilin peptidase) / N-methyltransferase
VTLELPNLGNDPILVAIAGVFGALIGSFLNVCILRWGAEPKQSVVRPPSRCPKCGRGLRWYENVPVVGWLALRGRCRGCRQPISPQYPLIELTTALLWAFMAWRYGLGLEALRGAAFLTLLLGIAMTDARAYVIPHEFSVGGAVMAIALSAVSGEVPGVRDALLGACFGAGLVLLIGEVSEMLAGQEAMGGGDCALMGMVGAFCGWQAVLPVVGVGAAISVVLFMLASLRPRPRAVEAGSADAGGGSPSLRLGMLLKLLLGGGVLLVGILVAMRLGAFGAVLHAGFDGVVAAGIVYYASFLLPASLRSRWLRIAGLLGAAVGVAVGAGFSPPRLLAGVLVASASIWYARRVSIADSPETAEALSAEGYLPFGVGLSLAAGLLALLNAYPGIRDAVANYLELAGVS